MPLLAGFVVQGLLAVSLCRLASTEGGVLGNTAVLMAPAQDPTQIFWSVTKKYSFDAVVLECV